jgi:phosphatidylglycerophosphate synthase
MDETPIDRRPIASRELRVWIRLASFLARKRVSANTISILGMIFGILCGLSFAATTFGRAERYLLLLGAAFCQLRLLCNMLDGMVAMQSGQICRVGELYNEIPDRISDSFALVGFGLLGGAYTSLGFLAALLAMFTAYVRAVGKGAGAPQVFHGPMAKPQRMFILTITAITLSIAPHQVLATLPRGLQLPDCSLILICIGCVVTALRRIRALAATLN